MCWGQAVDDLREDAEELRFRVCELFVTNVEHSSRGLHALSRSFSPTRTILVRVTGSLSGSSPSPSSSAPGPSMSTSISSCEGRGVCLFGGAASPVSMYVAYTGSRELREAA